MSISPIEPTGLGTQVAAQLRVLVVSGQLATGEHLAEEWLAAQFNVSRGPIRDALRILEKEGLVEFRRRGVYVVGLGDEDLAELYALRSVLEALAFRRCIETRDDVDWSGFERALEAMRAAERASDPGAYAIADLAFHTEMYVQSGQRRIIGIWNGLRDTLAALVQVTVSREPSLFDSLASHETLLALARAGDVDAALRELSDHMTLAHELLVAAHQAIRVTEPTSRTDRTLE